MVVSQFSYPLVFRLTTTTTTFRVTCCGFRYDFCMKTEFDSSLPQVVCRRTRVSCNVICVCLHIVVSDTYCVMFLFCLSSSCVLYVADFSGLSIFSAPSLFSNVYLKGTLSGNQNGLLCLTPLSAIFQLYQSDQF